LLRKGKDFEIILSIEYNCYSTIFSPNNIYLFSTVISRFTEMEQHGAIEVNGFGEKKQMVTRNGGFLGSD
jgi:hypothetical protein